MARCELSAGARPLSGGIMGRRARLPPVSLSIEERSQLEGWARRRPAGSLALRARIVLRCRSGRSNREIARSLDITTQTVGKWRARFVSARLRGLSDEPRSGAPRSISDALIEALLAKTLHEPPADGARWSSRRLAAAFGISQRAVLRIWHAFEVPRRDSPSLTAGRCGPVPRRPAASPSARSGRGGYRPAS
ncbi:MAG: helix-turn-helix domain-containing protein [Gammaproteobacteria bacterium]|nr:helix-turn-helix domain-containing protein [Gammaproteobacteria bacterium]